jgi:hypothetical protein
MRSSGNKEVCVLALFSSSSSSSFSPSSTNRGEGREAVVGVIEAKGGGRGGGEAREDKGS